MPAPCTRSRSTRCGGGWGTATRGRRPAATPRPTTRGSGGGAPPGPPRPRRYPTPINLVFEVRDPFCPWNDGRWHLTGHPAGSFCEPTDRDPDLVVDVAALGAAYLGGVSLATLQAAGRVTECSPGAVTLAATAFGWPAPPWCPDEF